MSFYNSSSSAIVVSVYEQRVAVYYVRVFVLCVPSAVDRTRSNFLCTHRDIVCGRIKIETLNSRTGEQAALSTPREKLFARGRMLS